MGYTGETMREQEDEGTDPQAQVVGEPGGATDPQNPVPRGRFPVPIGLFVALALYAAAVLGYVWATYWDSADYQAAVHYAKAQEVLGKKAGAGAPRETLIEGYRHLLEAARLKPEVRTVHDQLESLNWRFDERGWRVPEDLRHNAEAVAMTWMNIQKANAPILVVGVRDRGWAPDQLVEGPAKVFRWSPIGALLILVIWTYGNFNAKRVREQDKEAQLQQTEQELLERDLERIQPSSTRASTPPRKTRPSGAGAAPRGRTRRE